MTYYPVIIPTLNRYEHLKACVESLAANTHAEQTELVIGVDYPPSEKYVEGWKKIKEYVHNINGFKTITIIERKENFGASNNSIDLQNLVLEKYDAYIYTEDDNVFSPCFLDYMNKGLEKYRDDDSVYAISGYMNPVQWENVTEATITYVQDFMAWGIGCWKKKQQWLVETMPAPYKRSVCGDRKKLKQLESHLRELFQLIEWIRGNPSLDRRCDFTIACHLILNNRYVVNPMFSLVRNMGHDGSGLHCGIDETGAFAMQPISTDKYFDIVEPSSIDERMKLTSEWNRWKDTNHFSERQGNRVKIYYWLYMIFGYNVAEFAIKCIDLLARIKHKIYPKS